MLVQAEPIWTAATGLLIRLSFIIQALAVCCQHCCQAARQRPTDADRGGISAQHTSRDGRSWKMCPLLRTRRSGLGQEPLALDNGHDGHRATRPVAGMAG